MTCFDKQTCLEMRDVALGKADLEVSVRGVSVALPNC